MIVQLELRDQPSLMKKWNRLLRKEAKNRTSSAQSGGKSALQHEENFLPRLVDLFLSKLSEFDKEGDGDDGSSMDPLEEVFCERCLDFLTDLLSQLPTRRFVKAVLQERGIVVKCKMSGLYSRVQTSLFRQLVDLFASYVDFNIDEHSGEPFTEEELQNRHYEKLTQFQRLMFHYWDDVLHDYAMMDCATLQKRETLSKLAENLKHEELQKLAITQLKLVSPDDAPWTERPEFLKEMLIRHYEKRSLQREAINAMPLYPTEELLWDPNRIPRSDDAGDVPLPIPKLNLQFLSLHDYLMRNFELYRLEAAYEIQEDVGDVLGRVGGAVDEEGKVIFKGWARMASPIISLKIIEVQKPLIGYDKPAAVKAEITISTKLMRPDVKSEWDALKQHDVVFLMALKPDTSRHPIDDDDDLNPKELYGLTLLRGCEILEIKDEEDKLMNDFTGRSGFGGYREPVGFNRTLLVALDTAQYHQDTSLTQGEAFYQSFSLLMRRRAKENNFKSVLECMRDVMNESSIELDWLQDVFLGYGHPAAAHYTQLSEKNVMELDMKDTFLDQQHIEECFPDYMIVTDGKEIVPPLKLTFSVLPGVATEEKRTLSVEPYTSCDPGPFAQNPSRRNAVRFTPVQSQAIVAGMQPGLSMVVGPPGTGKTDVAVQILHMLYHNFPNQRTLLITHSNHALNDLFQKLMERDVPPRYLLRLGMGEQDLDTESHFSRTGRVQAMLQRRLDLLKDVERLARQLNVTEDMAYSCETAGHFWMLHVLSRWEKFASHCQATGTAACVQEQFPFTEYFSSVAPQPIFKGDSFEEDMEKATGCFRHLRSLFQELEECRAFELLKTQNDRVNYLLTKQAKIIAMTCTHAALKRKDFVKLRFHYDNVLMEESGQVLEIETFLPWTLQPCEGSRHLQRVVLIGDHHQLPPVVKHPAFQRYSHMDQSLFHRFIRLGMPFVQLDAQGRSRPSLAKLFNWRYDGLGNLACVTESALHAQANPGFAFDYQLIDVVDPTGVGESVPTPFFYQNLAEAEYIVRVYQFMRLLGYPPSSISILTTYNGQKHLLRDVLNKRCAAHPAFGKPHKVTPCHFDEHLMNAMALC